MATRPKGEDRRVLRTRQVIREAFIQIVLEKGFKAASVQEIAERANVSRGTFYAHYADKYALVEAIAREEFQSTVGTLPTTSEWNRETLHTFAQAVLDYFKSVYQRHRLAPDVSSLLDHAIHEQLNAHISAWLKHNRHQVARAGISLEMFAQIVSWALFGAAVQWCQESSALSSDQAAYAVSKIIMEGAGFGDVAPDSRDRS